MPSRDKSKTDLRNCILKEVYEENLRIAGKSPEDTQSGKRAGGYRKFVLLLFATLVVMLCFLPGLTPSLYSDDVVMQAVPHPPLQVARKQPLPPPQQHAANGHTAGLQTKTKERLLPTQEIHLPKLDRHTYMDYSLLFSQNKNVRLSSLFGLAIKTIVIDPGHGGKDPGAIGALGTEEKNITLDVARRLKRKLDELGDYHVVLTRTRDRTVSLAQRVKFANAHKADLFISIHVNSLPDKFANVVETYYYGPPQNAAAVRLASQENRDSGYTESSLKTLVQNIANTAKWQESVRLATSIQESLFSNVQHRDEAGFRAGIRQAPFVVLLGVKAPSVLAEISCITNIKEERKLDTAAYRDQIASYLEEGIVNYLTRRSVQNVLGEEAHERRG